jgi:hypothetical protein
MKVIVSNISPKLLSESEGAASFSTSFNLL